MKNEVQIRRFIRHQIKQGYFSDDAKLVTLLQSMTTKEIQAFWIGYSANKALDNTDAHIPHWKTKIQEKYFINEMSTYHYVPKKDETGKSVLVREDLINHVKEFIVQDIQNAIAINNKFRSMKLIDKIPFYLVVIVLIGTPFYIAGSLFPETAIGRIFVGLFYFIFGTSVILYPVIQFILKRKKRK